MYLMWSIVPVLTELSCLQWRIQIETTPLKKTKKLWKTALMLQWVWIWWIQLNNWNVVGIAKSPSTCLSSQLNILLGYQHRCLQWQTLNDSGTNMAIHYYLPSKCKVALYIVALRDIHSFDIVRMSCVQFLFGLKALYQKIILHLIEIINWITPH